jgi:GNAT superfamily N-acetyltransferase
VALSVVPLDRAVHDRTAFDCGSESLNTYLRTQAAKHQRQRITRVFVLVDTSKPSLVLGFYALSSSHISRRDITKQEAKKLPRYPVPTITLGRLAVDREAASQGFGTLLLMDAIRRCALVGAHAGVYAIVVDAKDARAKVFYARFGFTAIAGHRLKLYLPLATAMKALVE